MESFARPTSVGLSEWIWKLYPVASVCEHTPFNLFPWRNIMKMKPKANKKWRNLDYRYIAELSNYHGLSKEELDIAIHGIPFEGKRYPLCYVFWGDTRKYRKVIITLTGESGTLIGENIFTSHSKYTQGFTRGIVKVDGCNRVTDIAYCVLQFV